MLSSRILLSRSICLIPRIYTRHTSSPVRHSTPHTLYTTSPTMDLSNIVCALNGLFPLTVAEDWDNVGLLVEPHQLGIINKVLITNDLTEVVLEEALSMGGVGMVIAYHPPIFRSFKRLTQQTAKERIILRCVQSNISVYSPHTSLDNSIEGINNWLLSALGDGEILSVGAKRMINGPSNVVTVSGVDPSIIQGQSSMIVIKEREVQFSCSDSDLVNLLPKLKKHSPTNISVKSNTNVSVDPSGGRLLSLSHSQPLSKMVAMIKDHLKLEHVRLAKPPAKGVDPLINSVAVCAGAGGSVLSGVNADLYWTGEMSHHEVLQATSNGTAVVLCDHSNTERGYLQTVYRGMVCNALPGIEVLCSQTDKDPLEIV